MEKISFTHRTISAYGLLVLVLALVLAACGGGGGEEPGSGGQLGSDDVSDEEDSGDELVNPLEGGGGVLIFDGEEIPIDGVICTTFRDTLEVRTTAESGHRVLIDASDSRGIDASILDPDQSHWLPEDTTGDEAQRDGGTFTSDPAPYFNNSDDRIIEASFTVECP